MIKRLLERLVFGLERFIVRGAFNQLLFIAFAIVLVSVVGGAIVFLALQRFDDAGESVWWAFLRLSDPGYLGDDEGLVARTVSTVVTVLGYVLFMGALIAIMNQGLSRLMRRLEAGTTPISENGHLLILGWTNRTPSILRELLLATGRVRRFLHRSRTRELKMVVLAEDVSAALVQDARDELGPLWSDRRIILRTGDPLRPEHLGRTDFLNASAIIIPTGDFKRAGAEALDARTVKTAMLIDEAARQDARKRRPPITAELFDEEKRPILEAAYAGDLAIVPGAKFLSRLVAQNVRHAGLSQVYRALLSSRGNVAIYVRETPELAGTRFDALASMLPQAIAIGLVRPVDGALTPVLNPAGSTEIGADDQLVLIADDYKKTVPQKTAGKPRAVAPTRLKDEDFTEQRVLILGWSGKVPSLLREFESYTRERFLIDIASVVPRSDRDAVLRRFGCEHLDRVAVQHFEADYTSSHDLQRFDLSTYDTVVLFASDLQKSDEQADARSVLGYLQLEALVADLPRKPNIVVELLDPDNAVILDRRGAEIIVSPPIVSYMLAQVTLRRELWVIYEELFTVDGAEIYFRSPALYGLEPGPHRFDALEHTARAHGETLLGISPAGTGGATLAPAKDSVWTLAEADRLIVIGTYGAT